MSEANVKYIVRSLLSKLQLRNRTEAAVFTALQTAIPPEQSFDEAALN